MNDNTTKLLQELAAKMGTTTEYLWAVLLKQAHISAITSLFQYAIIALAGILLYKLHIKFSMKDKNGTSLYYRKETALEMPMVLCAVALGLISIFSFMTIGDVVNGLVNPEYWALDQIISKLK